MYDDVLKLKMLEEQFQGKQAFIGGEESVNLSDLMIVREDDKIKLLNKWINPAKDCLRYMIRFDKDI